MAETKAQQITVKDWKNFVGIVEQLSINIPPALAYAYRGQSKVSWELTPSFHRYFQSPYLKSEVLLKPEKLLEIETMTLRKFQSQAHLHVSVHIMDITETCADWWTLMQHHHAPTRLLDWTESPYIAAYHACIENFKHDGSIWLLHINSLNERMKEIQGENYEDLPSDTIQFDNFFLKPDAPQDVIPIVKGTKTDRMVAQQGLFTVCRNISGDQHKIISDAFPAEKHKDSFVFVQLVIPSGLKADFLKKLHAMNITAGALFPGLDGLGASVKELILMNTFSK